MTRQLALPFAHRPRYDAMDFLAGPSNEAALTWLASGTAWPDGRLALWGAAGVGKTHLLHIWAKRVGASPMPAGWPSGPIAIDDADAGTDEAALLHLLNAASEAGVSVLLTAREAPARWPVALPDLRSRLRAITAVEIAAPEEELLEALLARLLAERQLSIGPDVQQWLRTRLPRTPAAMCEAVDRLDHAGERLTRAVLSEIIEQVEPAEKGK